MANPEVGSMNPHDKDDFARAWAEVDATDDPVEIR